MVGILGGIGSHSVSQTRGLQRRRRFGNTFQVSDRLHSSRPQRGAEGEKPGLTIALVRAARRDPRNESDNGSSLEDADTSYMSSLIPTCRANIPQISW